MTRRPPTPVTPLAIIAILAVVLAAAAAGGCAVRHPPPSLAPAAEGGLDPDASWAAVLETHVGEDGRIDFARLATGPADLERYVAFVAGAEETTSPDVFATPHSKLAHYINAYNALAMYNAINSGKRPGDLVGFFVLQEYRIGGRYLSLYDFENKLIRPLGEPRIHFALNCMVRSCPRLPREPFRPETLEAQLQAAAREFCNDPRHVRVEGGRVLLSKIFDFYTKDFTAVAPSLVAYVNRYREEPLPERAPVRFIRYDWTLNEALNER